MAGSDALDVAIRAPAGETLRSGTWAGYQALIAQRKLLFSAPWTPPCVGMWANRLRRPRPPERSRSEPLAFEDAAARRRRAARPAPPPALENLRGAVPHLRISIALSRGLD